jgi:cytochrome c biogenesis protein CcmG, thiol:disulfide interchange protein DsbE
MSRLNREAILASLMVVLSGVMIVRLVPYFRQYNVGPGDRAPVFNLSGDNGTGLRLEDYRGKYVLLNFWATYCVPCVEELPSLNAVYDSMRDKGLIVLGVSVDENQEAYQRFLTAHNVTFPTARDPEWTAAIRYGTSKIPETYLIDREGTVLRKYVGAENWQRPEILNYLQSLL